jgi:hypothetical protein
LSKEPVDYTLTALYTQGMSSRRSARSVPILPGWLSVFLLVNILILDGMFVYRYFTQGSVLGISTNDACPAACIARINQVAGKTTSGTAKEYYVPLGSGTSTANDWADIAGASAYIDTASYSKIKQTTFEATVSVPAGSQQVWVRLFNATDKHPVWDSEVMTDSSGPILLTSKPIKLDSGNKLYQVQMKTQLKALTNLVQSRVRIITQ